MTTITLSVTAPDLKTITRRLSGDWGPTLHRTARRIGQVVALLWTLCSLASDRWQQLVAWAQAHQLHGLARLGLPGGSTVKECLTVPATVVQPVVVQRLAPALPPARPAANVAPPSIRHLAAQGLSQREIAGTLGLTRYEVQKALAA
jgi:hypothetical protein